MIFTAKNVSQEMNDRLSRWSSLISLLSPPVFRLFAVLLLLASAKFPVRADETFEKEVLPILRRHCTDCHSAESAELGLDLSSQSSLLHGSTSGPIVVAGQSAQSLMLQLVQPESKPHMPPGGQLSDTEIAVLKKWVDGLSPSIMPQRNDIQQASDHWAFQRLTRPIVPAIADNQAVRNPIDAFIQQGVQAAGLTPSSEATGLELVRRLYYDITGLPPSPEDVQSFLRDKRPDAYERLVDRLLNDPAYGEHWGRHWLDLARYADSGGFHDDLDRPFAWRYRDYVIASLNADKPYGEFVSEQLAGDALHPDRLDAVVATAFCRNGPTNDDNMGNNDLERERYRLDLMDDTIATTSAVFMGLTVGCARCHDHKFDPISQLDYYRMLAVFNSTARRNVALKAAGLPDLTKNAEKKQPGLMVTTEVGAPQRKTFLLWRGDAANRGPEVQAGVPAVLVGSSRTLNHSNSDDEASVRVKFANWLVQDDHPLTWRVIANRIWQQHFGTGLVATTSNFGLTGAAPTHPQLLDWLACELVASGGRLKALHRQILTSATYRQSSRYRADAAEIDPENRWLWRMSKQRLSAESIRDAILASAGTLNDERGGPGIKPRIPTDLLVASQRNKWPVVKQENASHWRRSIYIYIKRQLLMPMLELFDAPSTNQTCEQRTVSTVPTQALVLMNDEFVQQQAGILADRIQREAGEKLVDQIVRAHWLTLSRPATSQRLKEAEDFIALQQQAHRASGKDGKSASHAALTDLCHVLLNCNEFIYID